MKKITAMFLSIVLVLSAMFGTWSMQDVRATDSNSEQDNSATTLTTRTYGTGLTMPSTPTATSQLYQTAKAFDQIPYSIEATIKLDTSYNAAVRGGVVLGNNTNSDTAWNFEIHEYGRPRICFFTKKSEGTGVNTILDVKFDDLNVATGEAVRVNVVYDAVAKTMTCYLDGGVSKQTVSVTSFSPTIPTTKHVVGCDQRVNADTPRFKGEIYDMTIWSDTRTLDEVTNNTIETLETEDENLIAAYNFNADSDGERDFSDLSGNGYDIRKGGIYNLTPASKGMAFTASTVYKTEGTLSSEPVTMSAWIQLPESYSERAGVVFGNYIGSNPCVSFEIQTNGQPRFYMQNTTGTPANDTFSNVDIRSDQWTHLVYTVDETNGIISCYLNGELKQTVTKNPFDMSVVTNAYVLGGDLRGGNGQYFKGKIKEVALYSTLLDADSVKTLYEDGVNAVSTQPFSYYDVTDGKTYAVIQDQMGNNDLIGTGDIDFYDKDEVTDYAYSFAVVGDTQAVNEYDVNTGNNYLGGIYDWILENKEEKNIQYVFGLGDVTDNNNIAEWTHAKAEISSLDGQIPYSLVRGNHDMVGTFSAEDKTADYFTQYLGTDAYKEQFKYGGFYSDENTWNAWRTFTVGEVDYLMLSLDYGAMDRVLAWASDIIEAHTTHNVIITTHAYLYNDGTTLDENDLYPPSYTSGVSYNNGDDLWDKLVSQHKNIVLVMCGHDPCDDIVVRQEEGVNGNIVTAMLIDPQVLDSNLIAAGGIPSAMVAMLYFSQDGSQIQVEYYSTARDKYFKTNNQFTTTINVVNDKVDTCTNKVVEYTADEAKAFIDNDATTYPKYTDADTKVPEGYLFAGWYTDVSCDETSMLKDVTPTGTVYALFVPEHVLSVKAQISANLIDADYTNDTTGSIRFVTTVDSLQYKEVGFELSYVDANGVTRRAVSKSGTVYERLLAINSSCAYGMTPEGTFCAMSEYFRACTIAGLSVDDFKDTEFTVKPYWITMDGETVYGVEVTKSIQEGIDKVGNVSKYNAVLSGNIGLSVNTVDYEEVKLTMSDAEDNKYVAYAEKDGTYKIYVPAGEYTLTVTTEAATAPYLTYTEAVTISEGDNTLDIDLKNKLNNSNWTITDEGYYQNSQSGETFVQFEDGYGTTWKAEMKLSEYKGDWQRFGFMVWNSTGVNQDLDWTHWMQIYVLKRTDNGGMYNIVINGNIDGIGPVSFDVWPTTTVTSVEGKVLSLELTETELILTLDGQKIWTGTKDTVIANDSINYTLGDILGLDGTRRVYCGLYNWPIGITDPVTDPVIIKDWNFKHNEVLSGNITSPLDTVAYEDVKLTFTNEIGTSYTTYGKLDGTYEIKLPMGLYQMTVTAEVTTSPYITYTATVNVGDKENTHDVVLKNKMSESLFELTESGSYKSIVTGDTHTYFFSGWDTTWTSEIEMSGFDAANERAGLTLIRRNEANTDFDWSNWLRLYVVKTDSGTFHLEAHSSCDGVSAIATLYTFDESVTSVDGVRLRVELTGTGLIVRVNGTEVWNCSEDTKLGDATYTMGDVLMFGTRNVSCGLFNAGGTTVLFDDWSFTNR